MLQRNHIEPHATAIAQMKCMYEDADRAESFDQLLGIEGNATRKAERASALPGLPGAFHVRCTWLER